MIFPEPIGSSHPKVTNHDLRRVVSHQGQALALNCEGQAFPVPAYRCVAINTLIISMTDVVRHGSLGKYIMLCRLVQHSNEIVKYRVIK